MYNFHVKSNLPFFYNDLNYNKINYIYERPKKRKQEQQSPKPKSPKPKSPKPKSPKRERTRKENEMVKLWEPLKFNVGNLGITDINEILNLDMKKIKKIYHVQLKKWHPDRNLSRNEQANEMTKKIISSFRWLEKNYEKTVNEIGCILKNINL